MLAGRVAGNRRGKCPALTCPLQRRRFAECSLQRRQRSYRVLLGLRQWGLSISSHHPKDCGKAVVYRNIHRSKGFQTAFQHFLNGRNQRTTSPNVELGLYRFGW